MQLIRHWYNLFVATVWLALAFSRAAWYFKYRALKALALPNPELLSSKEKRRLQHYFYGTTYLSVVFCILRGYPRSRREKRLFTNLAALAYFFDDLVDAFRGRDKSGVLWQDNPEEYGRTADPSGLALHFLHNIYRELPAGDLEQFKDFMHRVFNVEAAGRQLEIRNWKLEIADLLNITAEKGGNSVLLFRRVLTNPLSATEQEALFQFGYLVQLCDDIFDLWHDRQAGTLTPAVFFVERNDVAGLQQVFENQVDMVRRALAPSPPGFSKGGRRTFFRALSKSSGRTTPSPPAGGPGGAVVHYLVSITRVCLRYYEDLQKKHGTLPLDDRKQMVVDMEQWKNRVRAARELVIG